MGHVEGQGLGAHGEGRTEPVEASANVERRGLGNGTLTVNEYLEYQNTPWKSSRPKTPPPVVKAGIPSRFVKVSRLDNNTEPAVVLTMFDLPLREKVKEIYGTGHVESPLAFVEFESEEDAAIAVLEYSNKAFGWNRQKARLERIDEQDIQQCSHDGPFDRKYHDKKCRLSIFLREQEEESAFQSMTVLVSGLNQSHELKHLREMLGPQRDERMDLDEMEFELVDFWDTYISDYRGTALVRFHDASLAGVVAIVKEWNGTYFKNNTVYMKCVPDSEYDKVSKKKDGPGASLTGRVHMNNLPPGADLDYIRRVLHKYEIGDQSFIMGGKTAVLYLEATDAKDILTRFPDGIRFQGRKHFFSEWVGGKKGKGIRGAPARSMQSPSPGDGLTEKVAGLNLGSNLGPQSSNWRSRAPPNNRTPQNVNQVIVRNLAFTASEQDIRQLFGEAYTITRIAQKKGFAFVTLGSQEQALKAIRELHGHHVLGRKAIVEAVRPQK